MPATTAAARSEAANKAWATRRARAAQPMTLAEQLEAVRTENDRLRKARGLPKSGKATPQIAALPGTSPLGFAPEPIDLEAVLREAESMLDSAYAVSDRLPTLTSFGEYQFDAHVGARRCHLIECAKAVATDFVRERAGLATEGVHLDAYNSSPYRVHAIVRPKHSITLHGHRPNYDVRDDSRGPGMHKPLPFSQTYAIGDQAIYDGYNYSYFGSITSIGAKTITITEDHSGRGHRLPIARFASRNDRDQRFERDQRNNWSD